jgi:hypothetical protein
MENNPNQATQIDAARLFKIIALKEYEIDILREKLAQYESQAQASKPLKQAELKEVKPLKQKE